MNTKTMSVSEAKTAGYQVDETCNPMIAYKGARFRPDEMFEVVSDEYATLQHQRDEAVKALEEARVDAARWRAFIGCARIRLFGWAGVDETGKPTDHYRSGYVHFGGEFWTQYPGAEEHLPSCAAGVLTAFADAALSTLSPSPAKAKEE